MSRNKVILARDKMLDWYTSQHADTRISPIVHDNDGKGLPCKVDDTWLVDITPEQDVAIKEFLSSYGRRSFMRGVYTCAILIVVLELIYYVLINYS